MLGRCSQLASVLLEEADLTQEHTTLQTRATQSPQAAESAAHTALRLRALALGRPHLAAAAECARQVCVVMEQAVGLNSPLGSPEASPRTTVRHRPHTVYHVIICIKQASATVVKQPPWVP